VCKLKPIIIYVLSFWLLWTSQGYAETFTGKLVKVLDGDTVEVLHDGKAERIRLAQIDCPEKGQPFGQEARQYVLDMAAHKIVTVREETVDRFGRTVGEVFLPDGASLNKQLVSAGYAWQYKQYSNDISYAVLESAARASRAGLWQGKNPIPPWEWRNARR
jgi:endonuclease YncB( thermonuclease family)